MDDRIVDRAAYVSAVCVAAGSFRTRAFDAEEVPRGKFIGGAVGLCRVHGNNRTARIGLLGMGGRAFSSRRG